MIKINKDFNAKIISLLVAVLFLFNSIAYGIDTATKFHLRTPLVTQNNPKRFIDSLSMRSANNGDFNQIELYHIIGESRVSVSKKYIDESIARVDAKTRKRLFKILDRIAREKGFSQLDVQQRYSFVRLLTYGDIELVEESIGLNQKSKKGLNQLFAEKTRISFADISRIILAGIIDENPDISFNTSNRMLDRPKILLIGPYKADAPRIGQFLAPPMGLYRIASYLDIFGVDVDVYDTDLLGEEKLEEMVRNNNYDVIGFSLLHPTIRNDIRLIHKLYKISPSSIFVAGGQGGAFNQEQLLGQTPIDVVVRGFGEFSMLDMAVMLDKGRFTLERFKDIPGLYFKGENREIIATPYDNRYTMDDFRAISLVYDFSRVPYGEYWNYMRGFYSDEQLSIMKNDRSLYTIRAITSSHCPMGCLFCSATNFLDDAVGKRQKPLLLPAKDIIILMKRALRAYPNTEAFYFNDDDFIISKNRIFELADLIEQEFKDRGLYFLTLARVDDVDPQVLKRMKEVGFGLIIYGVESFSDRLLQDMHKKVRVKDGEGAGERSKQAIEATLNAGIVPLFNLILFYPTTKVEDLLITIDIAVDLMQQGARVAVNSYVIPFAGSRMADMKEYDQEIENFSIEGSNQLFSTGIAVIPKDGDVKTLAEASLQMKPLILTEIRNKYGFNEEFLPLPVDTLALFVAIYRNLKLSTVKIDRVIEEIMFGTADTARELVRAQPARSL